MIYKAPKSEWTESGHMWNHGQAITIYRFLSMADILTFERLGSKFKVSVLLLRFWTCRSNFLKITPFENSQRTNERTNKRTNEPTNKQTCVMIISAGGADITSRQQDWLKLNCTGRRQREHTCTMCIRARQWLTGRSGVYSRWTCR